MSIEQELLYLDQIQSLFKVCAAADRLLGCLNEFSQSAAYACAECAQALDDRLADLEARGFWDREAAKSSP